MVTAGELYAIAMTGMALVALAAAIPVLRDIVREGSERLRQGGPAPPVEAADGNRDTDDTVRCPHCGAENEPGYVYCEGCAKRL
jgi:hypothetical protein